MIRWRFDFPDCLALGRVQLPKGYTVKDIFSLAGLSLTLIGACLLFFYGLPKKKIGNVVFYGDMAMQFDDKDHPDVPESEWGPKFASFQRRAKTLNSAGFALVAIGTFLQMLAILCKA